MRISLIIVGLILLTVGGIWTMQGSGVLPGSFMSGQSFWLIVGLVLMIAGLALIVAGARPRRPHSGG